MSSDRRRATVATAAERPFHDAHWDSQVYSVAAKAGTATLAAAVAAMLGLGQWLGAFTLALFLAASVWVVAFEHRLPALFDLLLVIAALLNAGGWIGLFHKLAVYDDVTHAFTIFAATLTLGYLTYHSVRAQFRGHGWLYILIIASLGMALGALWEIVEWFLLGTLGDPVVDLMMDGIGALGAGALAAAELQREQPD